MEAMEWELKPLVENKRRSAMVRLGRQQTSAGSDAVRLRRSRKLKDKSFPLHQAVITGDIKTVRVMVEDRIIADNLDCVDLFGMTPLHYAAKFDHKHIALLLLDNGAQVSVKTVQGSAVHTAIRYRKGSVASALLDRGASATLTDADGMNALHLAVNNRLTGLVTQLLQTSMVDINVQDVKGNTALHYAAINGDVNVCKALIDQGASIDITNSSEETALHLAAGERNKNIVETLVNTDFSGLPISKQEFINMQRKNKKTALFSAAQKGNFEIAKILIDHGADVDAIDKDGKSVLHAAASSGNENTVKILLDGGVMPNVDDANNRTPLQDSVAAGHLHVAEILLSNKALIDSKDKKWLTPFLIAVENNDYTSAKFLLNNGAEISNGDVHLKTALHYAVQNNNYDLVELLVESLKLFIHVKDEEGRTPMHYAATCGYKKILLLRIDGTTHLNYSDMFGETALHLASRNGHLDCVDALVKEGKDEVINVSNAEKQTSLHLAVINNQASICLALLRENAHVDPIDRSGWTPLLYAVSHEDLSILKILLEHNANLNFSDSWGNTCLMIAAEGGKPNAVDFLLESGADVHCANKDGDNFFDLAIDFHREAVCKVTLESSRWREALSSKGRHGRHFMQKLIKHYPDIAEIVLNRSTSFSHHHPEDPAFTVTFDFHFLEEALTTKSSKFNPLDLVRSNRDQLYFAPKIMSKYGREQLTRHPIVSTLISLKWKRLSRYFYYVRFLVFFVFNLILNVIVVLESSGQLRIEAEKAMPKSNSTQNGGFAQLPSSGDFGKACGYIILIFAILQIINEIFKLIVCRLKYFYSFDNYVELTLYIATVVYMHTFLFEDSKAEEPFEVAILCILLTWTNHLLYLQGLPMFQLYVVMFIRVCVTILKLLVTFGTMLLAFTLVFGLLYVGHIGPDRMDVILTRVFVMMPGELELNDWIFGNSRKKENNFEMLPYKELTYVVFILFLFLMTIAFTNLLIGLAVGDIEYVRSSAKLQIFKQQLRLIEYIQGVLPRHILKKYTNNEKYTYAINQQSKFERWYKHIISDQVDAELKQLRAQQSDFESLKIAYDLMDDTSESDGSKVTAV